MHAAERYVERVSYAGIASCFAKFGRILFALLTDASCAAINVAHLPIARVQNSAIHGFFLHIISIELSIFP